tara:strand:- start:1953 stop:2639 length:687 start_codon:yes stop_codon:yes gene_type:complete
MANWTTSKKILIWGGVSVVSLIALGFIIWKRTPFKKRIVDIANGEWALFGYQTVNKDGKTERKGRKENDEGFFQRVGDYWASVGSSRDGKDRSSPWSAAFISYVMGSAGGVFGVPFRKSGAHNKYIRQYINNRKSGNLKAAFVGYRINEKAPKVGDLVCYGRESGAGYDSNSSYKGHCDIVVAKRVGEIEVIGGNVADSVTKKILATDNKGMLIDTNNDWFAVIKNNA